MLQNALIKCLLKLFEMRDPFFHLFLGKGGGLPEADDAGNIFRPRTKFPFMVAAMLVGKNPDIFPDIKETDPLRAVEFMARDRQKVHSQLIHCKRDFPERLHRIGMKIGRAHV